MHRLLPFMRTIGSVAGLVLAATLLASAQGAPPSPDDRTAEQVYKNIKALKGTPANQLNQSMHLIKGALGVDCLYCHIEREWEKDDKPTKQTARDMAQMVRTINNDLLKNIKNLKSESPVINCTTCHRGQTKPALDLTEAAPKTD